MKALSLDSLSLMSAKADGGVAAAKIMSIFASHNFHPDHFYLTGFEGICIDAGHEATCEAVVSSVVPFDRELLIIGNSDACAAWRALCHRFDITASVLDSNDEDLLDALDAILSANKNITHIVCSSERDRATLAQIGHKAREYRRSFIVDNVNDTISMANIEELNVDFLITAADASAADPMSLVIARRSKLVQAEGNARSASHDIYAMWQQIVGVRCPTLEPMA